MILRPGHVALFAALAALSACSTSGYCLKHQDYQDAQSVPALSSPDNLKVPSSTSALRIPDEPATKVAYGSVDADGSAVCLDKPPGVRVKFVDGEGNPESKDDKPGFWGRLFGRKPPETPPPDES